ncbi:TIGR00296 family protein [Methanimicrococcus sp. OttesenSCG-928-J09]|nr:TIGR00296 family protein [Methanimicrococcus sp. OttesenSCG-928-J09]
MSKNILLASEGVLAVKTARQAISNVLDGKDAESDLPSLPVIFSEKRGAFVTLEKEGDLRGCIGYPYPVLPFKEVLVKSAVAAAFEDPRFFPIEKKDFSKLTVEVTTLTLPELLEGAFTQYSNMIQIGRHGLIAEYGEHRGLLLPQVAAEQGWDAIEFLCQTCVKAELTPMMWKYGAKIYRFEGQIFRETEPGGAIVESDE